MPHGRYAAKQPLPIVETKRVHPAWTEDRTSILGPWPTSSHNSTRDGWEVDVARENRQHERARIEGIFANKYIDGIPHTVEILDASAGGLRVRKILEPETASETFPLELSVGGHRFFAWTRRVWKLGDREALRIVATDPIDRARFKKFLRSFAPAV